MTPKFYAALWVVYFAAAAICWISGMLTLLTVVEFGFVAFGLVFTGMMCVLPTQVAHAHEMTSKPGPVKRSANAAANKRPSRLATAEASPR